MKLTKLRLVLDVDFDPQGVSRDDLKKNLTRVVHDATNNGTLTGDSPATVEKYNFKVIIRRPRKKKNNLTPTLPHICKKCGSAINVLGFCTDVTCVYSDHPQTADLDKLCESKVILASYDGASCPKADDK